MLLMLVFKWKCARNSIVGVPSHLCMSLNKIQSLQNCHLYLHWVYRYIFFEWYNIDLFVFIHTFFHIATVLTNLFILYLDTSLFILFMASKSIKVHSLQVRYYCFYFPSLYRRKYKDRKGVNLKGKEDGRS